jgi:soluble lytic murein transglycosylase-like protein
MKVFRLALPAAALAAVVSWHAAAAEENPVRQFFNEEFTPAAAQPASDEDNAAPAQVANVEPAQQNRNKKQNDNPWSGLTAVAVAPVRAIAPVINATNAQLVALVDKHAAAHGLPAAFARAIVQIESKYNPRATGRQREVGLMQIKYETARGIGFTGTREELYDPDTNLKWGMKYLAMAWKLGGNTPCGAVMKYQGGHRVTRMSPAANAYCAKVKSHMAAAR